MSRLDEVYATAQGVGTGSPLLDISSGERVTSLCLEERDPLFLNRYHLSHMFRSAGENCRARSSFLFTRPRRLEVSSMRDRDF